MSEQRYVIPFGGYNSSNSEIITPPISPSDPCNEILPIFKLITRNEFNDIEDYIICNWIALARQATGKIAFKGMTSKATAILAAHYLTMAKMTDDLAEEGLIYPLASLTGENAAESYSIPNYDLTSGNAYLKESKYGRWFLSLRQPLVMA